MSGLIWTVLSDFVDLMRHERCSGGSHGSVFTHDYGTTLSGRCIVARYGYLPDELLYGSAMPGLCLSLTHPGVEGPGQD